MGVFVRRGSTVICKGQIQNPRNTSGSILDPKNITYITSNIYQFNLTFRTKKKLLPESRNTQKILGKILNLKQIQQGPRTRKILPSPIPQTAKKQRYFILIRFEDLFTN